MPVLTPWTVFMPNADRAPPPPPVHSLDTDPRKGHPATAAANVSRPVFSRMALNTSRGTATAATVRATVPSLPTDVPLWSPLVGLAVSMGVGIVFGLWPAVKALRYE